MKHITLAYEFNRRYHIFMHGYHSALVYGRYTAAEFLLRPYEAERWWFLEGRLLPSTERNSS